MSASCVLLGLGLHAWLTLSAGKRKLGSMLFETWAHRVMATLPKLPSILYLSPRPIEHVARHCGRWLLWRLVPGVKTRRLALRQSGAVAAVRKATGQPAAKGGTTGETSCIHDRALGIACLGYCRGDPGMLARTCRGSLRLFLLILLTAISTLSTSAQNPSDGSEAITASMERLSIQLPLAVAGRYRVRKALEELNREPCDQTAIVDLGKALDQEGYRREAAIAHVSFSNHCGNHAPSLRAAANILIKLSDYPGAVNIASKLRIPTMATLVQARGDPSHSGMATRAGVRAPLGEFGHLSVERFGQVQRSPST